MASAWGNSWGKSWGNSWGLLLSIEISGGYHVEVWSYSNWIKQKKNKKKLEEKVKQEIEKVLETLPVEIDIPANKVDEIVTAIISDVKQSVPTEKTVASIEKAAIPIIVKQFIFDEELEIALVILF